MPEELSYEYILEAFQYLEDWESRYQFIIDLGHKLPPMPEHLKTDTTRVHQCMSMVWIHPHLEENGSVALHGHSDTDTIKGIVAILIAIFQGRTPDEIDHVDADEKFEELGLFDHLSPTRHVGVYAMVEQVKDQIAKLQA